MPGHLSYYIAASLDGHIAHADGRWDGLLTEGPHVSAFEADQRRFDAVVMGRRTYEAGLAAGLPEGAPAYPDLRNTVCSRTLRCQPQAGLEIVADGVAAVRAQKAEGLSLWLCGGVDLASSLFRAGLIDEIVVKVNPALFGAGLGMLRLERPMQLTHRETRVFSNGVVFLRYGCESSTNPA